MVCCSKPVRTLRKLNGFRLYHYDEVNLANLDVDVCGNVPLIVLDLRYFARMTNRLVSYDAVLWRLREYFRVLLDRREMRCCLCELLY